MSGASTNQPKPHKCPTVFVPDLPADSDSFETNKAYKRIVSAIVEVVSSTNNDGMSIGVEGTWGAGKTTIINLLRNELCSSSGNDQGQPQIRVIAFDAWAHEGDPLRLTFLETLKEGLITEAWINKSTWEEQLDIISGRKDIIDTTSDYGLGWFDYFVAFSFFLIPVGVAFLQAGVRNGITLDRSQPVAWNFLMGLVLCLATPLLGLGRLIKSPASSKETTSHSQKTRQSFLALLLNRTLSAGRTIVVKTPEPTSTEFEKQFKNMMSDALDKDQERRVVLVIDNLDRVQRSQAVAIWSTLQTFLQHRYHNPPKWLRQLYTIVLYDPKRLSETQSKSDDKTDSPTTDPAWSDGPIKPGEEQADASFLDKSFQIRFEVPPPILSDWRSYLLDLLSTALPRHVSEHHDIYRVLAVERHKRPPTIRELKVYVNQISAIHLQWEDTFPLSHVAYFVRLKRRHEEIVDGLVLGKYPEHGYSSIFGDEVRDTLAALTFNVERDIAYQILLGNPIQSALTDSSGAELKSLAATFENGFWEALENNLSGQWATGESEKASIAIVAIDKSGVLNNKSRAEAGSVRSTLSRIALDFTSWKPFNHSMAEGISIICQWTRLGNASDELVKQNITRLFEAIAEGLFDTDPVRKSKIAVMEWMEALVILVQHNLSFDLPEVDHVNIIVSKIQDRLKDCGYVEAEEISRLLEILVDLSSREPLAGDTLRFLAGGGQILHYFNYVHRRPNEHASCGWCILTLLCFAPSLEAPRTAGNSVHGYSAFLELSQKENVHDVQEFSKLLVRYKDTLTPVVLNRSDVIKDFLSECLKHIANGPIAESFFTAEFLLDNWAVINKKVYEWNKNNQELNAFFTRLANNSEITKGIQQREFSIDNVRLYRLLVANEKKDSSEFQNWCRANLEKLTTAEWESDIQGHQELVHLASVLQAGDTSLNLGQQYQNAILATIEEVLSGTRNRPFLLWYDMGLLLAPLRKSERHLICKKVYARVQLANGRFPRGFFSSFGRFISEVLQLDQNAVSSILKPIIEQREEMDLNWLIKLFSEPPSLLQTNADPEAVSNFRKILLTAISQPRDSITPLLSELARAIDKQKNEDHG